MWLNLKQASVLSEIPKNIAPKSVNQQEISELDLKLAVMVMREITAPQKKNKGKLGVLSHRWFMLNTSRVTMKDMNAIRAMCLFFFSFLRLASEMSNMKDLMQSRWATRKSRVPIQKAKLWEIIRHKSPPRLKRSPLEKQRSCLVVLWVNSRSMMMGRGFKRMRGQQPMMWPTTCKRATRGTSQKMQ